MAPNLIRRLTQYTLGVLLISFGVVTLLRTQIGAGAWDTTTYNLSALSGLTLGMASFLIQFTIVLIIVSYRKQWKYFLVAISILMISLGIDFWDLVVYQSYFFEGLMLRLMVFGAGVFVITFGLSLVILTHYPAAIFDELMLMIMAIFKTDKIFFPRLAIEMFALFLASIFGFIAGIGFGAVNIGSFILALFLPFILAFQLSWMRRLFDVKVES
jgi:uncharacterized membrane protein YczE